MKGVYARRVTGPLSIMITATIERKRIKLYYTRDVCTAQTVFFFLNYFLRRGIFQPPAVA